MSMPPMPPPPPEPVDRDRPMAPPAADAPFMPVAPPPATPLSTPVTEDVIEAIEHGAPVAPPAAPSLPVSPPAAVAAPVATQNPQPMPQALPEQIKQAAQALLDLIGDDECSEVLMNGPSEINRKVRGVRYHCPEINFIDATNYHRVINEVVLHFCDTRDRLDGNTVVVEGQLELPSPTGRPPMLARVHIIGPPGVQFAKVTIAKKPRFDLTLDDLASNGTMSQDEAEFLKACARGRQTVVVSGPTGSGKTTVLQALTHHYDHNDRVVVVEETPELRLPFGDVVYLRSTLERPGLDPTQAYSLEFWVKQANRMRMDRVIVGETRGAEMAEWLLAANSGAEGSATTVHANSPRRALDKILALATKNIHSTSEAQLRREIAATVDVIVQVGLVDGRHVVTEIEEVAETVSQSTGQIQTNTIFAFDRARAMHMVRTRPSDEFIAKLGTHGVPVNPAWFRQTA